ncbi:hypothetical protein HZA86_01600 [Candidatus Uhrbacteria bacterium]|nr:hypothetical protein [Candidatus Uhrbacteria bacterium]
MKIPDKLTRDQTILLTLGLVVVLGATAVLVVPKVFPSEVDTSPDAGSSVVDVERQRPLQTKFDVALFTDPRWNALKKVSGKLDTGTLGRSNPFAPLPLEEGPEELEDSSTTRTPAFPRF